MYGEEGHTADTVVTEPALLTRTSGELLGRRPLPRLLTERPLIFILGPSGVGKTSVARRIVGEDALAYSQEDLLRALNDAARTRRWSTTLEQAPALLFDDIDFLHGRYGALELLGQLLRLRAKAGRRTAFCQGADTSMTLLYDQLPPHLRVSVLLRFPVGSGRRRHVVRRCLQRGIPFELVREAVILEPWSYAAVERYLDRVAG